MATTAPSTAPSAAPRKPGWMSIAGGPKEPNRNDFRAKFQALVASKSGLFDDLKAIRGEFDAAKEGNNSADDGANGERNDMRKQLQKTEAERRQERDNRRAKDDELRKIRQQRRNVEQQLKELSQELGAFRGLEEIDAAIGHVEFKMETGGGNLRDEKMCIKRLSQLEAAKSLILQLQPLAEAIEVAEEREADLNTESKVIHERIDALNKDFESQMASKMKKEKETKKPSFDFAGLIKRREDVRTKIDALNAEIDESRAAFDKQMAAWNEWRTVAMKKYDEQRDAERAEREAVWKARELERKLRRRKERAAQKVNPFETEIDTCAMLVRFLEGKVAAAKSEKEAAERRKKLSAFDAAAFAPKGAVVANKGGDEENSFFVSGKKAQKKAQAPKKATKDDKTAVDLEDKNRKMVYGADKTKAFASIKLDQAPSTYGDVAAAVKVILAKKKEYESHIVEEQNAEDVTSSDDEAADEDDGATAVASTIVTQAPKADDE
jgi:chromosome segregation ATPase